MKYSVIVNEKTKTITVVLADGTKGVAKCCDTDQFNLATGIELALERAKVAKKDAEKPKTAIAKSGDVMELVRALEKALPEGQMVVVGNGKELTEAQKNYLLSLSGHKCKKCCCPDSALDEAYEEGYADGYDEGYQNGMDEVNDRYDEGYDDGHADGYDDGYADATDELSEDVSAEDLAERIREVLADVME